VCAKDGCRDRKVDAGIARSQASDDLHEHVSLGELLAVEGFETAHEELQAACIEFCAASGGTGPIVSDNECLHLQTDCSTPFDRNSHHDAGTRRPARREQRGGGVAHFHQSACLHFEQSDLIGGAEPVFHAPHRAKRHVSIAFEHQDDIHRVFQCAWSRQSADLGDLPHKKKHGSTGTSRRHK